MQKRSLWVVFLALILVSSALGVIAVDAVANRRAAPIVVPDVASGALMHRETADGRAETWQPDALLVRVGATEGPLLWGQADPPMTWDTQVDPFVGDGNAVVWTFTYVSPQADGSAFWVSIGGDGSMMYARELRAPYFCCYATPAVVAVSESSDSPHSSSTTPPPSPPAPRGVHAIIDSTDAYTAVASRPEFVDFAEDHPVFAAMIELVPGEDHSLWVLHYQTATFYSATAVVDAKTGEVIHVGEWPMPQPPCCDPPCCEPPTPCCQPPDHHSEMEGTIGSGVGFDFPVDDVRWLRTLHVEAIVESSTGESFDLDIIDSAGRVVSRSTVWGSTSIDLVPVLSSGVYTVYLRPSEGDLTTGILPQFAVDDARATVLVDVAYAESPMQWNGLTTPLFGAAHPNGGETWIPLTNELGLTPTEFVLTWNRDQPLDNLEVVILDESGNEWTSARGSEALFGSEALVLDLTGVGCCATAVVRHVGEGARGVEFVADATFVADEPTHSHDHEHVAHGAHGAHGA